MTAAIAGLRHSTSGAHTGWTDSISSWRHNAEDVRDDQCFTAVIGVGTAVIGVFFALLGRGTAVAAWVGLVTLCVTPGCAYACWHLTRDCLTRAVTVLAASLTWTILVSSVLAWLQVTSLGVVLAVTAGVGGLGSAVFLIDQKARSTRGPSGLIETEERQNALTWRSNRIHPDREYAPNASRREGAGYTSASERSFGEGITARADRQVRIVSRKSRSRHILLFAALLTSIILFASSVIRARGHAVGPWGLLPLLGPLFLIAVGLTVAVLLVALRFIRTTWPIAASALCLLLVEFNGIQVMLDAIPLSSWTYKHFGVVDYIVHGGALKDPYDIYQQWPGFFAAAAELVRVSGSSPLASGNWPHLFFEMVDSVVVFAIARRMAPRLKAVPYIAAALFFTVNWEGQYYYSPQSTAFLLALLLQYFILPSLETQHLRRPFRNWSWLRVPPLEIHGETTAVGNVAQTVGLIALFGAIVITHQMTPALVLTGLSCLWILGILRRPVVILSFTTVALCYLLLRIPALQHNFVLNGFSFSNTTGKPNISNPSQQQAIAARISEVLGLGMWGVTVTCVLSYGRRLGIVAIPAILAFVPFSLVMVSDYQGEGIYRVFLFSSPWCALIIARRLTDLKFSPTLRLTAVGCWAVFAALGSAQAQDFGMWSMVEVPEGEISASTYFLDHSPSNAVLILAAANFPSRLNAKYVQHNGKQSQNDLAFDEIPSLEENRLKYISPESLAKTVANLAEGDGYLVIAPSMEAYEDYYQFVTPGILPSLISRLKTSAYWRLWYQNDGTVIFQALPQGKPYRTEAHTTTGK